MCSMCKMLRRGRERTSLLNDGALGCRHALRKTKECLLMDSTKRIVEGAVRELVGVGDLFVELRIGHGEETSDKRAKDCWWCCPAFWSCLIRKRLA